MKGTIAAFFSGAALAAAGGYAWMHHDDGDLAAIDEPKPVSSGMPWNNSKTIAVGEVVNGIQKRNRLVVFQAYVTATTTTEDGGWWPGSSSQTMLTPAFVNYYVDMRQINVRNIRIRGNDVFVPRPAIIIERPNVDLNNVRTFNKGVWTTLTSTTDKLRAKNDKMAMRQLVSRAKMRFLVDAATRGAEDAIANNVRAVLVAQGHPEAVVHVAGAE